MFEHFGLRDVITCALKFKAVFVALMVCALLFGGFVQYRQAKSGTSDSSGGTYISTGYFMVDDSDYISPDSSSLVVDNGRENEIKRFSSTYQALIKTDLCNEYVYNRILDESDKKEFLSKSKIDASESSFSPSNIGKLLTCKASDNTAEFSVAITTDSKETSEQILQYYSDYLTDQIQPMIKENTLIQVGSTTQKEAAGSVKSSKPLILSVGGGILLYLLFVFTWALFLPTLNRKSDFAQYGVDVLAELK